MSIRAEVADMIGELGEADEPALCEAMPHLTRHQISTALKNAQAANLIVMIRRQPRTPGKRGAGLGLYVQAGDSVDVNAIIRAAIATQPNSVFALAQYA